MIFLHSGDQVIPAERDWAQPSCVGGAEHGSGAVGQAAAIHDDIMRMPMQYETLVGDMGSTLSGGQKQRVLLARALYRQPKILVMDEGTAHLDAAHERAVNAAIAAMGITRIIIAHRRETIEIAERVFVMQGGKLHPMAALRSEGGT